MANRWTPEQLEAITQRDCNLLVAAAAGAGKTAVLVERIIRKITDDEKPVDIDKLLVVTFTNAAATEMRERIGNALSDALEANPSSVNLQKQMTLLDRASIMTLHSFCLEVIKSNFHRIDLDPLFRISDETESTLMKLDALEELFEEKYENEEPNSEFFKLVDSYGRGRDDNTLREIILTLHRFTRSHPWPEQWLAHQAEAYNLAASACLSSTPWARVLLKSAAAELQGLTALLEKAASLASRAQGLQPYCGVLEADLEKLNELLRLCETANSDPAVHSSDKAPVNANQVDPIWDALYAAFSSFEPARLPRCGKDADTSAQDEVKAARNQMKEKIKKLLESGFNTTSSEIKADLIKIYPQLKYLSQMVSEFELLYQKKKKSKGLLDFNDLEHYCLNILIADDCPTAVAESLRERYDELLVDEYQDSNLIQELILGTVSGNQTGRHNIFMVGDVKQSIYRFRQAKPELFLSKYSTYPHECGHEDRVIQLYKNFRSRAEVINGANFIFRQIMSAQVGELNYTQEEYLNSGAEFIAPEDPCSVGGAIEVHILDVTSAETEIIPATAASIGMGDDTSASRQMPGSSGKEIPGSGDNHMPDNSGSQMTGSSGSQMTGSSGRQSTGQATGQPIDPDTEEFSEGAEGEEESLDNIQSEARIVGKRIRSLISQVSGSFNVYDKKKSKYRPAEYRDIVILMRATRNWADIFTEELAAMGIPAYADAGLGYFKTVEVETMLALLQIIDNPLQDIPMLAVLRSPIGGFSADELSDIRLADRSALFQDAMKTFAAQNNEQQENIVQVKTAAFLCKLDKWRVIAQYTPTDELVWQLLTETGYYSYVGILPGGPERQANLRMLFERAKQYEETSYRGLFNFISFINKLKSGGGDMGSAKILGENDNVIRIMSIHKSKGLEFPIVIVAGCGKKFNMLDLNAGILLHQELGYGPDLVDLERRTITSVMPKYAIRQKMKLETLSEEMRILYVAFTRAKEKLIITGSVRDAQKTCSKWCAAADTSEDKLPFYEMLQASNYLDWIGPALVRHEASQVLRNSAGPNVGSRIFSNELSCWDIKLWGIGATSVKKEAAAAEENVRRWLKDNKSDDGGSTDFISEQIVRMLEWKYPFGHLTAMPAKVSVTELKRRFMQEDQSDSAIPFTQPLATRPLFMEKEKGFSAARKGTIMHFVMQHLDLKKLMNVTRIGDSEEKNKVLTKEIQLQIASMVVKEQLTEQEAEAVHSNEIAAFFSTTAGSRMLNTAIVHRETAFTIEMKCREVIKDLPAGFGDSEMMLLQGVIDCWFETEEGLVLLDYKTDYVPAGGADKMRQRYRVQLDYYVKALERITGQKVTEKFLYLFHTNELLCC